MENYKKGKNVEEELTEDRIPIEILPEKFLWMHVKGGTKVSNVVEFAEKAFNSGKHRSVVWSGSGGGVPKTISCAEIMKRNYELHQVTRLVYQKIEEYWDPLLKDLDPIVVTRRVPAIHIFLTLDTLDPKIPGYQKAKAPTTFWPGPAVKQQNRDDDYVYKKKRNSNGNNRNYPQQRQSNNRTQKKQQTSGPNGSNSNASRKGPNKDTSDQPQPGTSASAQTQEGTKS